MIRQAFRFTALDLRAIIAYPTSPIVVLITIIAVAIMGVTPYAVLAGAFAAGLVVVAAPFALDERAGLDRLYATLPLTRAAVVTGRTLTLILQILLWAVVGILASCIAAAATEVALDPGVFTSICATGLAAALLVLSVQVPLLFTFGFARASILIYLPLLLIFGAAWGITQLANIPLEEILAFLGSAPWMITAPVTAIALLALSTVLSTRLYRRRSL